ncbi:MAG TPA: OmpA family protein [Sphingobium sp.]|nr:OmpA family protein [Sphingobium sp.]
MIRASRSRWALSFADLCLLLLGFFVLLQADQATRNRALNGIGQHFGATAVPRQAELSAQALFEPGEALLSEAGRDALLRVARPFVTADTTVQIQSIGLDDGQYRFDAWDLAAARLGAVARALVAAGIAPQRLRIAGLAEQVEGDTPDRQMIRLLERPATLD